MIAVGTVFTFKRFLAHLFSWIIKAFSDLQLHHMTKQRNNFNEQIQSLRQTSDPMDRTPNNENNNPKSLYQARTLRKTNSSFPSYNAIPAKPGMISSFIYLFRISSTSMIDSILNQDLNYGNLNEQRHTTNYVPAFKQNSINARQRIQAKNQNTKSPLAKAMSAPYPGNFKQTEESNSQSNQFMDQSNQLMDEPKKSSVAYSK